MKVKTLIISILLLVGANAAFAQTTELTYQGRLTDAGMAANANYDFQFALFSTASGGTQIGSPLTRTSVAVSNGVFTVQLDFGAGAFPGADRFLEIGVRPAGSGSFTTLVPRQQITASSYGIRSLSAATADTATNAAQLGGVAANQYVVTSDARLADPRSPTAGSSNYIQNDTNPQAASNFNISGNGTAGGTLSANAVNTTTQYNIGGARMLSAPGTNNLFAGPGAGNANTGTDNSFFGASAGLANTSGVSNTLLGSRAGRDNTSGLLNTFVGTIAGLRNTSGSFNSFFGASAGAANVSGTENAFFGTYAGLSSTGNENSFFGSRVGTTNTTGSRNSFFGFKAGSANTTGFSNSFFGTFAGGGNTTGGVNSFVGYSAGALNASGQGNSFFGAGAGESNTTGIDNTFIGIGAGFSNTTGGTNTTIGGNSDVGSNNLTFATAIGTGAIVSNSNSVVLGRTADTVRVPGGLNVTGKIDSATQYNIGGNRVLGTPGTKNVFAGVGAGTNNVNEFDQGYFNSFFGAEAGLTNSIGAANSYFGAAAGRNSTGLNNSFFGSNAGTSNSTGSSNSFFGATTGFRNTTGDHNTLIGQSADVGSNNLSYATAIGAGAEVSNSNSVALGRSADTVRVPGILNVTGGASFNSTLAVAGNAFFFDNVSVTQLGSAGSTNLCRNGSNQISTCSSSLRYKKSVQPFSNGLEVVRRLRPIAFSWREGGMRDVGFAAEAVYEVEPLLTTRNDKGEIEGVKYGQITTVLVNAAQQQQQIIELQQRQIDALKKLVCLDHPDADVCR